MSTILIEFAEGGCGPTELHHSLGVQFRGLRPWDPCNEILLPPKSCVTRINFEIAIYLQAQPHTKADVRKTEEDLVGRGALLAEFDLDFAAKSIDIDSPR